MLPHDQVDYPMPGEDRMWSYLLALFEDGDAAMEPSTIFTTHTPSQIVLAYEIAGTVFSHDSESLHISSRDRKLNSRGLHRWRFHLSRSIHFRASLDRNQVFI